MLDMVAVLSLAKELVQFTLTSSPALDQSTESEIANTTISHQVTLTVRIGVSTATLVSS